MVPLHERLASALDRGSDALHALAGADPLDRRDEALTLLCVTDLHLAPIDRIGGRARFQHHPAVAALKGRLEERYLRRLPPGPAEVDDAVAACQIGMDGEPKMEMARNYWDEMGRGNAAEVHTELHRRFVRATGARPAPDTAQPVAALERRLLGAVLATNRWLQPEMVGALGLIELQAGPRCRKVVRAMHRLGAPDDAVAFYDEHAVADPRHGKDWLDHVVAPLAADPRWAAGIVRGAAWRAEVNRRFFEDAARRFAGETGSRAA